MEREASAVKHGKAWWSAAIPSTQNPVLRKGSVGSIPSSGTSNSIAFTHLPRSLLKTVPRAATPVGQFAGKSRGWARWGERTGADPVVRGGARSGHAGQRSEATDRCRDGADWPVHGVGTALLTVDIASALRETSTNLDSVDRLITRPDPGVTL